MTTPERETYQGILVVAKGDPVVEGRWADWHTGKVDETNAFRAAQTAAMDTEIAELTEALLAAKARRQEARAGLERDIAWHTHHLVDWCIAMMKRAVTAAKSIRLSRGYVIGSRKQAAKLQILDPAPLMAALPQCTKLVLVESEAKKHLAVACGSVVFAKSGEAFSDGTRLTADMGDEGRVALRIAGEFLIVEETGELFPDGVATVEMDDGVSKRIAVSDGKVAGELVPEGTVAILREAGERYYIRGPHGLDATINLLWQPEADEDEADGDGADEAETDDEDETDGGEDEPMRPGDAERAGE